MAITIQLAIALAALLVEDQDLVALYEGGLYFAYYLGSLNGGGTNGHVAVVLNEQHLFKFNSLAVLYIVHVVHEELLALFGLELLTVNLNDCVHFLNNNLTVFPGGGRAKSFAQPLSWPRRTQIGCKGITFF